jgi:hypothetical protein
MKETTPINQQFIDMLQHADAIQAKRRESVKSSEKVHIVGAGRTITAAYEQLRNAAEYTEEHLLLQRAIRRFYKRVFLTRDNDRIAKSGEELAVELTLAGYIQNDSIPVATVKEIGQEASTYFTAYRELIKKHGVQHAEEWVIAPLAVQAEGLFTDHSKRAAFVQFSYRYFIDSIDPSAVFNGKAPDNYEAAVFVAVHRMLLKSDNATIRHALLERYQATPDKLQQFTEINRHLDTLLDADVVEKIGRIVNRRGAPLRVLWRMVDESLDLAELLKHHDKFVSAYEKQIQTEYRQMNRRINRGIAKSVVFLIITKFLIGLSLEVPYDYVIHGGIVWLPLIINLIFPPIYMVLLRLTLVLPGKANTNALVDRMEGILYQGRPTLSLTVSDTSSPHSSAFNFLYTGLFVAVFSSVAWGLWLLGFSALHLGIFFIFLSTASFLGFRLSRIIREIETVDTDQNGVSMLRDFLYLPFVVVGRWMSEKYAKVNIVAMILDMVIELPLKTVIRLVQQWGSFISSKKDEL